jgi:hypothetical protein
MKIKKLEASNLPSKPLFVKGQTQFIRPADLNDETKQSLMKQEKKNSFFYLHFIMPIGVVAFILFYLRFENKEIPQAVLIKAPETKQLLKEPAPPVIMKDISKDEKIHEVLTELSKAREEIYQVDREPAGDDSEYFRYGDEDYYPPNQ